jgi:hypothetical protein
MIKYICDICQDEITSSNALDPHINKFAITDKNYSKVGVITVGFIPNISTNTICQNCFNAEIQTWLNNQDEY